LQVLLQAILSSADLVYALEQEPLQQVAWLKQSDVTAMSATPSLWRQLLMTGQLKQLALRYITLGGEIADQTLLNKLADLFPSAKIRHIYASTEVGVGFTVTDGRAGFPAKWLKEESLSGALKISDKQHLLVKPKCKVCQVLEHQVDSLGYLDTLDLVQQIGDRVYFLGRVTGVINVGGNKVIPEKVEQVILQCACVSEAKVYAKKSALMGELVVADVCVSQKIITHEVKQQVLKACREKLQRYEIPTKINIVENISHDPSGKLNRKPKHG
jgi:acyl-CoA synthetase (AMP-forming)/AMP-acid ligase II